MNGSPPHDVTYCAYAGCPFKDCESHLIHTKRFPAWVMVSVADYSGTCRRYIGHLVDKVLEEGWVHRRQDSERRGEWGDVTGCANDSCAKEKHQ